MDRAALLDATRRRHPAEQGEAGEALAAPRLPHQRQRPAPVEGEADPVHRMDPAVPRAGEGDPEVLDVEDSAHAPRGSTASRSASPTRLADRTVMTMARP